MKRGRKEGTKMSEEAKQKIRDAWTKKRRRIQSKEMKKLWEDEKFRKAQKRKMEKVWNEKPDEEYTLGKRVRQTKNGKRDRKRYAHYQNLYQSKFRSEHPNYYRLLSQYRREKYKKLFKGSFKEWCDLKGINPYD